ncbi:MTC6 [Candida pseudojiufengensis]|uniref:MTC6 n=1 Tax=Candida pseudojiufengensis TaxID=497109 RepID=UPI00222425F2|nr:MTC6 [Candida pseudojiufengensis]KAI5960989.1 MTC6 [Candida pseudojiufengensis]
MQLVIKILCLLFFLIDLTLSDYPFGQTPTNETLEVALRTQRDVSKPIPIDQLSVTGLSLSSIFQEKGYTTDSLSDLVTALNKGSQVIMIDLYWNEFTSIWQLCPAPFPQNASSSSDTTPSLSWNNQTYKCDLNLATDNVMSMISSYIMSTNTDYQANFIHVLLNLKSIHYEKSNQTISLEDAYKPNAQSTSVGNSTLTETFSKLSQYIFDPSVLNDYRSQVNSENLNEVSFYNRSSIVMPTLRTVLLNQYRRLLVNVISNDVVESRRAYTVNDLDKQLIFFNDTLPTTVLTPKNADNYCDQVLKPTNGLDLFNNLSLTTNFRYILDSDSDRFSLKKIRKYVRCGLSPVFNATSYNVQNQTFTNSSNSNSSDVEEVYQSYAPYFFWSWGPGEPMTVDNSTTNNTDNDGQRENVAYKCVMLRNDGWHVGDCYERYEIACQNKSSPNDWLIPSGVKKTYFDIRAEDCPDGYNFSLPRSNIEMLSLLTSIGQQNSTFPIWIDLNDITISTCFVSGGPYAQCPYQRTVTSQKFARMIAPASVICIIVLILILMEKIFRTNHIQANRKRYWKKKLTEYYSKNDYEGVPS